MICNDEYIYIYIYIYYSNLILLSCSLSTFICNSIQLLLFIYKLYLYINYSFNKAYINIVGKHISPLYFNSPFVLYTFW